MTYRCPAVALVLLGTVACNEPGPGAPNGAAAPGDPRAVLDRERRALSDPERYPLRDGLHVDEEALRTTLLRLRDHHGPQVAIAYAKTIEALPTRAAPDDATFEERARFSLPDEPAAREAEALNWLFDRDVEQTARRVFATYLTLMMVTELHMTTHDVAVWMAFLQAAEPAVTRCGTDDGRLWICLDYGPDLFVLELSRLEPAWIVRSMRWMQRRPAATPEPGS